MVLAHPRSILRNGRDTQRSDCNRYPYDYGSERVRDNQDGPPSLGLSEARRLHRHVYYNTSLGELSRLSPAELGHAAAYQAYVKVMDDPPVPRNIEYEREVLIGLAVSEASRLAQQGGREQDTYSCSAASEAAARTASRIFAEANGEGVGSSPYRMGSYSEPYDWEDDEAGYPGRSSRRSLSRGRRPAFVDAPTIIPDPNMGYGSNRFAPGSVPSDYALGRTYLPSSSPRYPPTPFPGTNYTPSIVVTNPASNNALPQVYQLPRGDPSFNGALVPASSFGRARSASFSYPQQYATQPMQNGYGNTPYTQAYPRGVQPEQTIVIQQPRKHRHKHRHRHRSRSR